VAVRILITALLLALVVVFPLANVSGAQVPRELPTPFPSSVGVPEPDDPTVVWLASDQNISRADAARRAAWQLRAGVLIDKARPALGGRFGGIWIDEQDYGRIKVGMVDATAADQGWVNAQGFRGAADIVEVPRSLNDLETAAEWLWSRALELNQDTVDDGSGWTLGVGITPSRSTVNLSVPPPMHVSDAQRAFVDQAEKRYGEALFIEEYEAPPREGACTTINGQSYCDPPLRAGIAINHAGGGTCTGAFPARSRSDNKLYQLTAGHCTRNRENVWRTRFPNNSVHDIGAVHNCRAGRGPANNCSQGGADYAILRVNNPSGWSQGRGWVFVRASGSHDGVPGTNRDPSYEMRNVSRVSEGWRVCKSGRHSTSCGRIFDLGYSYTSGSGYSYAYLARARYCWRGGDSGAPVYAYHNAYGIHQGGISESCTGYFQSIVDAQNGLNVDVMLE